MEDQENHERSFDNNSLMSDEQRKKDVVQSQKTVQFPNPSTSLSQLSSLSQQIDLSKAFSDGYLNAAGERTYVPLRKKLKRKSTGREDNFVSNYGTVREHIWSAQRDIDNFRRGHRIEVDGHDIAPPIRNFSDIDMPPYMLRALESMNIYQPTPIQLQTIPCALAGRDIVGLAETGSGKTIAFLIPLLLFLRDKPSPQFVSEGPLALILAPTRELVEQIASVLHIFFEAEKEEREDAIELEMNGEKQPSEGASAVTRVVVSLYGGTSVQEQISALFQERGRRGIDVLVASPGRLIDILSRSNDLKAHSARPSFSFSLSSVGFLVMDEVDHMLNLQMESQLRAILGVCQSIGRQTLLFSATLPISLERLSRSAVLDPVTIRVAMGEERTGLASSAVTQEVVYLSPPFATAERKRDRLVDTLRSIERPPVLIFCNSIASVDYVVTFLRREQFHVGGIHSAMPQKMRFQVMEEMRQERVDVLVATDLASRGLDLPNVDHVILFEIPRTIEAYIHRCGRTGRAGQTGTAISFLTLDCSIAKELKNLLKESGQRVPIELENTKKFGQSRAYPRV